MKRAEVLKLVEHYREAVVPEWRVKTIFKLPADVPVEEFEECWASVFVPFTRFDAELYLAPNLMRQTDDFIRHTICHEFVHVILRDYKAAGSEAGGLDRLDFAAQTQHEEEKLADRIGLLLV